MGRKFVEVGSDQHRQQQQRLPRPKKEPLAGGSDEPDVKRQRTESIENVTIDNREVKSKILSHLKK